MARQTPPKLLGTLKSDLVMPKGWEITVWEDDSGAVRYVAEKATSTENEPLKRAQTTQVKFVNVYGDEV